MHNILNVLYINSTNKTKECFACALIIFLWPEEFRKNHQFNRLYRQIFEMMKEKQSGHFSQISDLIMCFSCKYLVDSRFNFFDELIDEIKKIKVFLFSILIEITLEITGVSQRI